MNREGDGLEPPKLHDRRSHCCHLSSSQPLLSLILSLPLSLSLSLPLSLPFPHLPLLLAHTQCPNPPPKLTDKEEDESNCPYYCRQPRPNKEQRDKKRPAAGPQQNNHHECHSWQNAAKVSDSISDIALLEKISLFALPQGRGRD